MKLKFDLNVKRFFLLLMCFITPLFSYDVFVTTKDIKFKDKIYKKDIALRKVDSLDKKCIPLTAQDLEKGSFSSSHYIFKNSVLCMNDVVKYEKKSVIFNFGTLEIEQEGKILFENDKYIRIKKQDGSVEKIYKSGIIE